MSGVDHHNQYHVLRDAAKLSLENDAVNEDPENDGPLMSLARNRQGFRLCESVCIYRDTSPRHFTGYVYYIKSYIIIHYTTGGWFRATWVT